MDYTELDDTIVLSQYFKRDANYIKSLLEETKDGRVITKKPLDIIFPESFMDKDLAVMDADIYTVGIFALVDPTAKKYAVFNIPAKVSLGIPEMSYFTYREDKYRVLHFEAMDTLINNTMVVEDDKLDYWIYDNFIALARVPWYMNYDDVIKLTDLDGLYVKKWLGASPQIVEMIYSNIARNPNNHKQMYRYALKVNDDVSKIEPEWVPLKNISLGSVDTTSKIMGSYFDDGLTSALAEPSKKLTEVEKVLRS